MFQEHGAFTISADEIVHNLLSPTTDLGKKIIALLGPEVVVEGKLARDAIAEIVFRDPHLLTELEHLLHPAVQRKIESAYTTLIQNPLSYTLFCVEIPLLFESGQDPFFDVIVLVTSDAAQERFQQGPTEFQRRSRRLLPIEEKRRKADFIIENNGTLEELEAAVKIIYQKLYP